MILRVSPARREMLPDKFLDDRHAPANAESLGSDAQARGSLVAFPFVQVDATLDPADRGFLVAT